MANNNQYNDYEYDAYFGGSDSSPSFDFSYDVEDQPGGFYGDIFNTMAGNDYNYDVESQLGGFYGDIFNLLSGENYNYDVESQDGGFYGNIQGPDYSVQTDPLSGLVERFDTSGNYLETLNAPSVSGAYLDELLRGSAPGISESLSSKSDLPSTSQGPSETNYLLDGVKIPGEGTQIPATSLYKTEEEVAEKLPSEGLKEPEMPGLSEMGGAQGTYVEVPTQFDEEGNRVPNTGGYVGALGFVPYDAVPSIGDPRSWINRPDVLGKTVFGEDFIKSADLTKGTTTTTTPGGTKTEKTTPVNTTNTKTIIDRIVETIKGGGKGGTGGATDKDTMQMLMALLGGLYGLYQGSKQKPAGYQGGIPKYTAQRNLGKGVTYTKAATGGLMDVMAGQPNENVIMMANGGLMGLAAGGRYLRGGTDGMADKLEANIDGKQPARLSHGEFVIPADVVSHLGNGNSEAGADVLYEMMAKVRKARTGNSKQGKEINPRKYTPA